jgi:short-subunit dehydrogenase
VAKCRAAGAAAEGTTIDVTDRDGLAGWIEARDSESPIDLVIANAGISAGGGLDGETAEQTRRILAVNVDGVMNTVLPLLPRMQARGRGQVALMSSIASFRGIAGAPAYCASKAAVRVWGEALRGDLAPFGIGVSVICPGFVRSRMTAVNRFRMPFLMDADRAARIIVAGLGRGRARIAFPWPTYWAMWLVTTLGPRLTDPFLIRLPRKSAAAGS